MTTLLLVFIGISIIEAVIMVLIIRTKSQSEAEIKADMLINEYVSRMKKNFVDIDKIKKAREEIKQENITSIDDLERLMAKW